MSDDEFGVRRGEYNGASENPSSVTRYPAVTANLNSIFDLLSDAHRRYLLYYAYTMERDVIELEAAADAVCKYEAAGTDTSDQPAQETIQLELHHSHLPRLAKAGLVDYDPRQGTIRFTGSPAIEEWLEHARYKELD